MQNLKNDQILSELFQGFNSHEMILFIGRDPAITIEKLPETLFSLPWNLVVTTRSEIDFVNPFNIDGRMAFEAVTKEQIPLQLFNRRQLCVLKLVNSDNIEDEFEADEEELQEQLQVEALKTIGYIIKRMGPSSRMVIIGYAPSDPLELKPLYMKNAMKDCRGGEFQFYGMDEDDNSLKSIIKFANSANYPCYAEKIHILLADSDYDLPQNQEQLSNVFYMGGQPVELSNAALRRFEDVGRLLTVNKLEEIKPYGRIQQSTWFFNFLTRSSLMGPQWYGYRRNSDYYVKRKYEDVLVKLVRNLLFREGIFKGKESEPVKPIILEGDSGSSKTVVLGALAYRIFNEHKNPVIFIPQEDSNNKIDLEKLDEMMQEIEQSGNHTMRILLIWDGSAYRDITELAKRIVHYLQNRGRAFVFVCSSYKLTINDSGDKHYCLKNDSLVECSPAYEKAEIVFKNNCYYVHATREVTTQEINSLKMKVNSYLPREKDNIKDIWSDLVNKNSDIFDYFYRLINVLQPRLELGLTKEERIILNYVQEQIDDNRGKREEHKEIISPMQAALKAAGINLSAFVDETEGNSEHVDFDIRRFNTCVALFGRYKLDTPVSFATYMLFKGAENSGRSIYSSENRKVFNLVTTAIPWLSYHENAKGVFCFSYRSPLEADIFLKKNFVQSKEIIDIICDLLDCYKEDYYELDGVANPFETDSIQTLIRLVGPNSTYNPYKGKEKQEFDQLQRQLSRITDKLKDLRKDAEILNDDAGFEMIESTFLREMYSWKKLNKYLQITTADDDNDIEEKYEYYISKTVEAAELAGDALDRLNSKTTVSNWKRSLYAQPINNLRNEMCLSYMNADEIWTKALEEGVHLGIEQSRLQFSYQFNFDQMCRVISSDPENGYYYNTLFKMFEREYGKTENEEHKLEMLSTIDPIIDEAQSRDIHDRGAGGENELADHIATILDFGSAIKVSIESIRNRTCSESFQKLFDETIADGKSSALCFVCRKELKYANIAEYYGFGQDAATQKLSGVQKRKCQDILDFMKSYEDCVNNSSDALYLELKVAWMLYNGYPLVDAGIECKPTFIEKNKWGDISDICEKYERITIPEKRRPIITLIHALALAQDDQYEQAQSLLNESGNENNYADTMRRRIPYLLCDSNGTPRLFKGVVKAVREDKNSGYMQVVKIPYSLGNKKGVYYKNSNVGLRKCPIVGTPMNDLLLGIGYVSFSLYTAESLEKRDNPYFLKENREVRL